MDVQENCIQLKIDAIIADINQNGQDNQNEEKNQITALLGYSHCLDLYEFLEIFSKIQKNELLVQTAIIYDSIGYNELAMELIDESLLLIPNVPSIIIYKCGLYVSLNKLNEAQKWLLKYKYLIGENVYENYIHDSIQVVFYYLLDYEEYIIFRKILSIENNYSIYIKDNIVLYFIKIQMLEKLAQKFKSTDKKRYNSYRKESNEIKNKYILKNNESEFLLEQGIRTENFTKILTLINPNILKYKPKKLIEYKNGFNKAGFSLFFTLMKICKILKLGIEVKKYQNILKKNRKINNKNNNFNDFLKNIQKYNFENDKIEEEKDKKCQELIKNLCNNIWIKNDKINSNKENKGKENIVINKNISNILRTNYYIREGYYSHLNLKKNILKNIEYNENYKNNKLQLEDNSFLDDMNTMNKSEIIIALDEKNKKSENNIIKSTSNTINKNTNVNNTNTNDIIKTNKRHIKKVDIHSNKTRRIKNSLSDIIKKVITSNPKENNKNKRNNKNPNNNNENKESIKSNKFCSTDKYNNQMLSQTLNKKREIIKIESISGLSQKKKEKIKFEKDENKEVQNKKDKEKEKEKSKEKENEKINNKKEKEKENIKKEEIIENKKEKENYGIENNKKENKMEKNNNIESLKDLVNGDTKKKLLTTNSSNKKMSFIGYNDQAKPLNKNIHNNQMYSLREKKMDTDYGKYKDIKEINLVSYCLKQLIKKKDNKNKNLKQKEIVNLTDKIDLIIPQKMIDLEKKIVQINEHKFIKSKSKKKKFLNKSIKKQINTFTYERKMSKSTQKHSDNNLLNVNKSSNTNGMNGVNGVNFNANMKNLKNAINNYGNKKELSKFKSLNYLHGNFHSNNNYLNINFNNYMNYNFNYSNRHDEKNNLDFRFNLNSDNKKREGSYSKKMSFRTINLDFKNMSTKLNNYNKKHLLNSFIDSKDKSKKSSDNKRDFVMLPFNKVKNSPSGEMTCLKKKVKNFKSNLIKQKTKTSFSKYMLYNIEKKKDVFYFSKSINTSEYNKYKNASINKSKNVKNTYNKTLNSKSISKINK